MNFVFWLLVVIALIFLWFLSACFFRSIGIFFFRIWKEAVDELNKEDEEKEK